MTKYIIVLGDLWHGMEKAIGPFMHKAEAEEWLEWHAVTDSQAAKIIPLDTTYET